MNNNVKIEGNTNVVIQDSKVDGDIIISITDSSEITDITGKVVKSFSNFQNSEIDLSNLNSGIYFIK